MRAYRTDNYSIDKDSHAGDAEDEATEVEGGEVGGEGDAEPSSNQSQPSQVERHLAAKSAVRDSLSSTP